MQLPHLPSNCEERLFAEDLIHSILDLIHEGTEAKSKGGREKAIIFTESTRTQEYVRSILEDIARYKGKVVLFNGSNNDWEPLWDQIVTDHG